MSDYKVARYKYMHEEIAYTGAKQLIPSLSSILATLLKLRFSVPESSLLTYCGLTPNLAARSALFRPLSCI